MATLVEVIAELVHTACPNDNGQNKIEFGLIVSIISLAIVISLHLTNGSIVGLWRDLVLVAASVHF